MTGRGSLRVLVGEGTSYKSLLDSRRAQAALAAADQFDPDACVLDISMPGMDGYELAKRLRQRDPKRRRVLAAVTAHHDYGHLTRAADSGFDLHFTKPADPKDLIDQIGNRLRSGR